MDWQGDVPSGVMTGSTAGPGSGGSVTQAPGGPWGSVGSCFLLLILWVSGVFSLPHGADALGVPTLPSPTELRDHRASFIKLWDWHSASQSILNETETQARIFGSRPRSQEFIASLTVI